MMNLKVDEILWGLISQHNTFIS